MAERRPKARRGPTTHNVQAVVEGVVAPPDGKIEFMGGHFGLADKIGLMPLLQFANAAKRGIDSTDMDGMAALYAVIRDCFDQRRPQKEVDGALVDDGPSEWDRFERHAIEQKADGDDLMPVVQKCIEAISARPTRPPGDSSAGRQITSASLKDPSLTEGMVSVADLAR